MKRICLCLCVVFAITSLLYAEDHEIRKWTSEKNSSGKVFSAEGYLKEITDDGKTVVLVIDGKEKKIDVSRLSREDKDYIQSLGEAENLESESINEDELEESSASTKTKNPRSFRELKEEAERGDPSAQKRVGDCYFFGNGVEEDKSEAVAWYKKSANQKNAEAQLCLGNWYLYGNGVELDKSEATKWFRKAAKQGLPEAQYKFALRYANGDGVDEDQSEAVKWCRKAAEQGYADAQHKLGLHYATGDGIDEDKSEARKWWRKAAEQGNVLAQTSLGSSYVTEKNESEGVEWYRKAAEQGYAQAQYELGVLYNYGKSEIIERDEAIKWLTKAAHQGHQEASKALKILDPITTNSVVSHDNTVKTDSTASSISSSSTRKVTFANYSRISNGMSRQQVFDILGPGVLQASSSFAGYSSDVYQWEEKPGDIGGIIMITFADGKVVAKSQAGF